MVDVLLKGSVVLIILVCLFNMYMEVHDEFGKGADEEPKTDTKQDDWVSWPDGKVDLDK